jgi:hypothetical protein
MSPTTLASDAAQALQGVTEGPWLVWSGNICTEENTETAIFALYQDTPDADERFVTFARAWVPEAAAALTALSAERDALAAQVAELTRERDVDIACNRGLVRLNEATQSRAEVAEAKVARLEWAMRWYADPANYETQYEPMHCGCCTDIYEPINDDKGAKARAALTEGTPE